MAANNFSNTSVETTLSSGIDGSVTSLTVAAATGWPAAPFVLVIEPDTGNEELILVGAKAGTVFSSLTRGYGGTSGVAHVGSTDIKHVFVAEDARAIYTHAHDGVDGSATVDYGDLANPYSPDFGEVGDIASVAVVAAAGVSNEIARADHVHPLENAQSAAVNVQGGNTKSGNITLTGSYQTVQALAWTLPSNWGSATLAVIASVHLTGHGSSDQFDFVTSLDTDGGSTARNWDSQEPSHDDKSEDLNVNAVFTGVDESDVVRIEVRHTAGSGTLNANYAQILVLAVRTS